jgi:NitT/TauT family transport system substrate-binding protein
MRFKWILSGLVGTAALLAQALPAVAESGEIRLALQFSMGYLQLNVMQHQQLIEKHAKALGIPNAKVSWFKFNGPTAVNEALIPAMSISAPAAFPACSRCGRAPRAPRKRCAALPR